MPPKRNIIPYNHDLKALASQLRKNMTLSEVLLWNELKQKRILGYDFDRQRPIDKFIVDFYCKKLNLAIEIDGDTHIFRYDYDEERQSVLEKLGVKFLRFEDFEVKKNMSNVLRVIEGWIKSNEPTPDPYEEGSLRKEYTPGFGNEMGGRKKPTPGPSGEGSRREEPTPETSRRTSGYTGNKVGDPDLSPSRGTSGGANMLYK